MIPITFNGFFPIILTFGGIQGIIISVLLLVRAKNKQANTLMAIFLLSFALPTLNFAFFNSSIGSILPERIVFQPFILLFGPSFYFFIRASHKDLISNKMFFFHSIPFVIFILLELGTVFEVIHFDFEYHILNALSSLVYSVLTIKYYRSTSDGVLTFKFGYIQVIILSYCLYVIFTIVFPILLFINIENRLAFIYSFGMLLTILVYSIGFIAYWKSSAPGKKLEDELNHGEIEKIRVGLDRMISDKFYLNSGIKLQDMADILETSPRYVSRFINDEFNMSCPDLVNSLRINEAKRLIKESPDNPKMLAIALDSGFTNKTTFNAHFKKQTWHYSY